MMITIPSSNSKRVIRNFRKLTNPEVPSVKKGYHSLMQITLNKRLVTVSAHILVWAVILNLPYLLLEDHPEGISNYLKSWVPALAAAAIFYGNYFYLIPKLLFSRRTGTFVIANLLFYAVMVVVLEEVRIYLIPPPSAPPPDSVYQFSLRFLISFVLFTSLSVAIRITLQWFRSEELRNALEMENLTTELLNLKNQLNPHFLFNTLNNIYSLVNRNKEMAQEAILQLANLMRYLLYDSNGKFVLLNKEIDFANHYIDLMKLRVMPGVKIDYQFQRDTSNIQIAPLLFISLIENAFKHGVSDSQPSFIKMDLKLRDNNVIVFSICNSSFPKNDQDRSGSGIGLENLRKRLTLLYPGKHEFLIREDQGVFKCTLTIHTA